MAINIADPGTHEAALRDALAGRLGLRLLASGTITDPVAYIDLSLPTGYMSFQVVWSGMQFDASNNGIAGAFSPDGGTTFYNDTDGFTSYIDAGVGHQSDNHTVGISGADSLADFDIGVPLGGQAFYLTQDIYPGATGQNAIVMSRLMYFDEGGLFWLGALVCNALVEATGRQNLMRFLPWGSGDCNPPTSGKMINAGSYVLWGVPTP